jgi:hypothetical protein
MKRRAGPSHAARRFKIVLRASYLLSCVPSVPSRPLRRSAKLSGILNNPSSSRLEELHTNRKAVALHWLAVGHPS